MNQFPAIRDILLFLGGLAGVFHETVLSHAERPTLLILFAAMMGLPAFLRQDEAKKQGPPLPPPPPPYPPYPPQLPGPPEEKASPSSSEPPNG